MKTIAPLPAALSFSIVLEASTAFAQSTATIAGTAVDLSGAVVLDAQVTAHSNGSGIDQTMPTDGAGLYGNPALDPGEYRIQVRF